MKASTVPTLRLPDDDPIPESERRPREGSLAALLDFNAFVARSIPLAWLLEGVPSRVAAILRVQIASLYLLEPESDTLVLRSNAGYDSPAIGRIRLQVGEGLTGLAVASRQVLAVEEAPSHERYRRFPELGEDRYPVFAVAPLCTGGETLGALVVQRESGAFCESELLLLGALAGTLSLALREASTGEVQQVQRRKAGGGTRRVVLPGRRAVEGRAIGPLAAIRRPPRRPVLKVHNSPKPLLDAFAVAERVIRELAQRASNAGLGSAASFLDIHQQILSDSRFKERALELLGKGAPSAEALGQVAREAVRTATRWTRSAFLEERARDLEDLCDALTMLAVSDPRAAMPSRSILMSDALTVYDLIVTAKSRPVGVALTERAGGPRTDVLLQLLGLPAVLDVGGLFRWASDGDIALLEATQGLVLINPSRAEVAELRQSLEQAGQLASG